MIAVELILEHALLEAERLRVDLFLLAPVLVLDLLAVLVGLARDTIEERVVFVVVVLLLFDLVLVGLVALALAHLLAVDARVHALLLHDHVLLVAQLLQWHRLGRRQRAVVVRRVRAAGLL